MRMAGLATLPGGAADQDDVPQAQREELADEMEGRVDVDAEHLLQGGCGDGGDRPGGVDPGRVHERLHFSQLRSRAADGFDAALLRAEICLDRQHVGRRRPTAPLADDARSLRRSGEGDATTDPARRSGHEDGPAIEVRINREHAGLSRTNAHLR